MNSYRILCATAMATAIVTSTGPAFAQEASNAPTAESDAGRDGEIIVTARRRAENVQDVPSAVTVVTAESLEANNVQTLDDLQRLVPSLTASGGVITANTLAVSIRGQGNGVLAPIAAVQAYLNDVPLPIADGQGDLAGGPGMFLDLESVQVLKGPQGTLFGRNATGGAVLFQTARPTSRLGGRVRATYGSYDTREIEAMVNLPIVDDRLIVRVAAMRQLRDGYTRVFGIPGRPNGVDADNRDAWAVRGTVLMRPTDWLENLAILTVSEFEDRGTPQHMVAIRPNSVAAAVFPTLPALVAQQAAAGQRVGYADIQIANDGHFTAFSNMTTINLSSNVRLRNIFGIIDTQYYAQNDTDGTSLPVYEAVVGRTPQTPGGRQLTEELQLSDTSLSGRLTWVGGLFLLDVARPDPQVLVQRVLGNTLPAASSATWSRSKAIYGQAEYELLPGMHLTLGGRYTWDQIFNEVRSSPTAALERYQPKFEAFTWTAGLDYRVTPDTLVYLASRRGYRSGFPNRVVAGFVPPPFGPEYVTDAEFGVKADWQLGGLPARTNVALFYQGYDDIQVTQQVIPPSGIPINTITNAGQARLFGGEIEASFQLTTRLQIGLLGSFINIKYTEFEPGVQNIQAIIDSRYYNRPRYKFGASFEYRLPLPDQAGQASLRGNFSWQSESGDESQPFGQIEPYGLLNLSADWRGVLGSSFDLSVFATNALNTDYSASVRTVYNTALGFVLRRFGEPRMIGVRVGYRFGGEAD